MYGETPGVFKALLQLANFTLGPDATLNTEILSGERMCTILVNRLED